MRARLSYQLGFFFSLSAALVTFFYLYGSAFLNPFQCSWMLNGDPSQHFYGFNFFLNESWRWPPGSIATFNSPFGTSLVYTDSIPIIAIPLKLLFKNHTIQFHGLWILLCFLLQGAWGYRFSFEATRNSLSAFAGSVLLLLFPSFLFRGFDPSRHYSCLAHFLIFPAILWAMEAFQKKRSFRRRLPGWLILLFLSLGIHFYFFYLNLVILCVCENELWNSRRKWLSFFAFGMVTWACMEVFGYFTIPLFRSFDGGFASYSMNFLSWLNPQGYSITHFKLPEVSGDQREGFQYLGLGNLFLFGSCLVSADHRSHMRAVWMKAQASGGAMLAVGILLFAWSIRFSLGSYLLPDWLTGIAYFAVFYFLLKRQLNRHPVSTAALYLLGFIFSGHLLRSSGRAGWYASYLLIFAIFQMKPKWPWLIFAVFLQLIDVAPMLQTIRAENQSLLLNHQTEIVSQQFVSQGLEAFLGNRKSIRLLGLNATEQAPVAEYALHHQLDLGPVYVARGQVKVNHAWSEAARERLLKAVVAPDEAWVITDSQLSSLLQKSNQLTCLKIGNYLWIKANAKN